MGKLLDLIGGGLIEKTDKLLDNLTTSKEEKLELKNKLTELYIEEEKKAQEQVTSRWEADMASDSFLAKNIRPIVLVFLTFIFVLISFFDGNVGDFKINEAYKPIYQTLLMTVYGAYFAGRSIEKVAKKKNNG
jgi:hypothetical protein